MPEVYILDVGHGNCALIVDEEGAFVIDAAPGPTLLELLEKQSITEIDYVFISHADSDHIGGLLPLLTNSKILVKQIFLNPDAIRNTRSWLDLRVALNNEPIKSRTTVHVGLTASTTQFLNRKEVYIEVLAPSASKALGGVGSEDVNARKQSSNALSAVIGIGTKNHRSFLFAGDVDRQGLDNILKDEIDLNAQVLVFPHHGGSPGSGSKSEFAKILLRAVLPKVVVFSIARNDKYYPHPEIIAGLRQGSPDAHIACTQLSPQCANRPPVSTPTYHDAFPARGGKNGCSCAGTLKFTFGSQTEILSPTLQTHSEFITMAAPTALCRREILHLIE